ncbi:MAG: VIT1/CCC1 transporter family protein [Patescibacteria group bacterium]
MRRRRLQDGVLGSIREIIFGLEDSLVSTLGVVTGIAAGTGNSYVVILSGLVLVVVESISMSAGSYLSSKAATEVDRADHERPLRAGAVMFISYIVGGLFPLAPYLLLPIHLAYAPSIIVTVLMLFLVGVWKGKMTKRSLFRSGVEMMTVSLTAAVLGYVIGRLVAHWAGVAV